MGTRLWCVTSGYVSPKSVLPLCTRATAFVLASSAVNTTQPNLTTIHIQIIDNWHFSPHFQLWSECSPQVWEKCFVHYMCFFICRPIITLVSDQFCVIRLHLISAAEALTYLFRLKLMWDWWVHERVCVCVCVCVCASSCSLLPYLDWWVPGTGCVQADMCARGHRKPDHRSNCCWSWSHRYSVDRENKRQRKKNTRHKQANMNITQW